MSETSIKISPEVDTCGLKSYPFVFHGCVTFSSSRPVSQSGIIVFSDEEGRCFPLALTLTADNCLLSCFPFLASQASNYQIVCEQGKALLGYQCGSNESLSMGEPVLVACCSTDESSSVYRPSSTSSTAASTLSSSQQINTSHLPPNNSPTVTTKTRNQWNSENTGDSHVVTEELSWLSKTVHLYPQLSADSDCSRGCDDDDDNDDDDDDDDDDGGITQYYRKVLNAVQRWFMSHGWPSGPNPVSAPESFARSLTVRSAVGRGGEQTLDGVSSGSVMKETRTVYEMISHLCGREIPGCDPNVPLPTHQHQRALRIFTQHSTLLAFIKTQGGSIGSVNAEYLMEYKDFIYWMKHKRSELSLAGHSSSANVAYMNWLERMGSISEKSFKSVSRYAWITVLLQLIKIFSLARVTSRQFRSSRHPGDGQHPVVDPTPTRSNVYSVSERILIVWLNHHYERQRSVVWPAHRKHSALGDTPCSRWIVNFDVDLLDSLVLAATVSTYIPHLMESHFEGMYTEAVTGEQCLHNALLLLEGLRSVGLEYDVEARDLTSPNPLFLLLFVLHLYYTLPQYIPSDSISFTGKFRQPITAQVKLTNPSGRPLVYRAIIAGRDHRDFCLLDNSNHSNTVYVPQKSSTVVTLRCVARFISGAEAVLIFASKKQKSGIGSTLVFSLNANTSDVETKATTSVETNCYTTLHFTVPVMNSYEEAGSFYVIVIEERDKNITSHNTSNLIKTITDKKYEADELKCMEGVRSFYCKQNMIYLQPNCPVTLELMYVPLYQGQHECTLLLRDERLGEIIYSVRGSASQPNIIPLPWTTSSAHSSRISSVSAIASGVSLDKESNDDSYQGEESMNDTAYFRCVVDERIEEILNIPIDNKPLQQAAASAACMLMSAEELEERGMTGLFISPHQLNYITQQLSSSINNNNNNNNNNNDNNSNNNIGFSNSKHKIAYKVAVNSRYFIPESDTIYIPYHGAMLGGEDTVPLRFSFQASAEGVYTCDVTLTSTFDTRSHRLCALVLPPDSSADPVLDFTSSLYQPLVQNIPIMNSTSVDWIMKAELTGLGFSGPIDILVARKCTVQYPLKYIPRTEGIVQGRLILRNAVDDIEYRYNLNGRGLKCPAVGTLSLSARVMQSITEIVAIPNMTDQRLLFKVECDLSYVAGESSMIILSKQTGQYCLSIRPTRRGRHQGVISFIATQPPRDSDSDVEDNDSAQSPQATGYRVWYHIDLYVEPGEPLGVLDVSCPSQGHTTLNVKVNNPLDEPVTFDVSLQGHGLCGPKSFKVYSKDKHNYEATFSPTVVGEFMGSVIFYHPMTGEFWYGVRLFSVSPSPTALPMMEAELGGTCVQYIELCNDTDESLCYESCVSNPLHFSLVLSDEEVLKGLIELCPGQTRSVPLLFNPSDIGLGDHTGSVVFSSCTGDVVYGVFGRGLLPQTSHEIHVTSMIGINSIATINFTNPTDVPIIVTVSLRCGASSSYLHRQSEEGQANPSVFQVLLKKLNEGICMEGRQLLQIPIGFTPSEMGCYEALCHVTAHRQDNQDWIEVIDNHQPPRPDSWRGHRSLTWTYVLRGRAEGVTPGLQPLTPLAFSSRINSSAEKLLEVTLTGTGVGEDGWGEGVRRVMRLKSFDLSQNTGVGESERQENSSGGESAERFRYHLEYESDSDRQCVESFVKISLVGQGADPRTGLTTLSFHVIFTPTNALLCDVKLIVERYNTCSGGLWSFPLRFSSTCIEPDGVIVVPSTALNVPSYTSISIRNKTETTDTYRAEFVGSNDLSLFTVTPDTGTLPPCSSLEGIQLIITYCPHSYGRNHQARLLVQTGSGLMWSYDVRGVIPRYTAPHCHSAPSSVQCSRSSGAWGVNHVISNLHLSATAASSPFKRQPLLSRRKTYPALHLQQQ